MNTFRSESSVRLPKRLWPKSFLVFLMAVGAFGGAVWLKAQDPGPQPAFGELVASPPNFVAETPTTLTFRIRIDSPTLNPTTVELQRVDAQGNLVARVRRMYDNGQGGDPVAGDRLFTSVVSLNEPAVGKAYFRVAAAFRGNKQNSVSSILPLDVDPFPLPPDPGQLGKATLEGVDTDKDGVRDDVQRWIAIDYSDTPAIFEALTQYAKASQNYIETFVKSGPSLADATAITAATTCLVYAAGPSALGTQIVPLANQTILNTDERINVSLTSWRLVHDLPPPMSAADRAHRCASLTVSN